MWRKDEDARDEHCSLHSVRGFALYAQGTSPNQRNFFMIYRQSEWRETPLESEWTSFKHRAMSACIRFRVGWVLVILSILFVSFFLAFVVVLSGTLFGGIGYVCSTMYTVTYAVVFGFCLAETLFVITLPESHKEDNK